jgi:hypothetical protein
MEEFKDKKDFMNGFLQAKRDYPSEVTDNAVIGYLIINVSWGFLDFTSSLPFSPHLHLHPDLQVNNPTQRSSPAQTQPASS